MPAAPKPLRIGMREEIGDALGMDADQRRRLGRLLGRWVGRRAYLKFMLAPCAQRYGLDGRPVGPVPPEHQAAVPPEHQAAALEQLESEARAPERQAAGQGDRLPGERGNADLAPGVTPMTATIEVLAIRKSDGTSSVKAFVDVRIGGVTLKGFKIVQQDGQKAWLAMPSVKLDRGWQNVVELSKELRERATELVLAAWETRQPRTEIHRNERQPGPARGGNRGMGDAVRRARPG